MLTEKQFDSGSLVLNYAQGAPSEHALVVLHGLGSRWQTFMHIMPFLLLRWHVHAVDLRGHGRSGRAAADTYTLRHYAEDIVLFVERLIQKPVVLFGHSLGAMTAVQVAATIPDKVRGLILEDPPLSPSPQPSGPMFLNIFEYEREMLRAGLPIDEVVQKLSDMPIHIAGIDEPPRFADLPGMDAAYLRYAAKTLSLADPEIFTPVLDGTSGQSVDLASALPRLACPVLLLQADPAMGGALSDESAQWAASQIADCILVSQKGVGHNIHRAQPEKMFRVLSSFFESL